MMRQLIIPLGLLTLSACSTAGNYDVFTRSNEPGDDPCGAHSRDYLIGQKLSDIDLESLAEIVRPIHPGDMVTMDHRPERLNIDLDEAGIVVALRCG